MKALLRGTIKALPLFILLSLFSGNAMAHKRFVYASYYPNYPYTYYYEGCYFKGHYYKYCPVRAHRLCRVWVYGHLDSRLDHMGFWVPGCWRLVRCC